MRPPLVEVSARIGAMIVHSAVASGVAREELERVTGFSADRARDPDARIPIEQETALWDEAARLAGDADFGLHTAERLRPGMFDVLDYVVRTAPTPREALERLARYNRLEHDAAVFALIDRGNVTRVEHRLGAVAQSRHAAELTIASLVVIGGQIAGASLPPLAVELRHAAPASTAEHVRVFGVLPRFGAEVNAIEWEARLLARPNPAADPVLGQLVMRHAEALLAARPAPATTYVERVRQLVVAQLGSGTATLPAIAKRLGMSERSLQRRLSAEQSTFDAVIDDVRRELALRYLADASIAVSEVAYLLGYSEPSPFHRAFRRWTGTTPGELRQQRAV